MEESNLLLKICNQSVNHLLHNLDITISKKNFFITNIIYLLEINVLFFTFKSIKVFSIKLTTGTITIK